MKEQPMPAVSPVTAAAVQFDPQVGCVMADAAT
ncbi:hypothetical protein SAMN06265355_102646 [Actinomadura mexicana]|uniref:Uncharacterized protein n=1 Tax=Actinomadura mexicana TaxID=134959 RepID=A0A238W2B7_9ACTN|nr:hypothetical protein SAMN06265355_102646 [Actinomadura mexicana]